MLKEFVEATLKEGAGRKLSLNSIYGDRIVVDSKNIVRI